MASYTKDSVFPRADSDNKQGDPVAKPGAITYPPIIATENATVQTVQPSTTSSKKRSAVEAGIEQERVKTPKKIKSNQASPYIQRLKELPEQLETIADVDEADAEADIMKQMTAMFAKTEITSGESKPPSLLTRIAVRMVAEEKKQKEIEDKARARAIEMTPGPIANYKSPFAGSI